MKRFFSFLLAFCFLSVLSVTALADGNSGSIYLDYLVNGSAQIQEPFFLRKMDYDSTGFFAGVALGSGSIRAHFDYGDLELKPAGGGNGTLNTTLTDIGAGFRLVEVKTARLDLTASYLTLSMKHNQNADYNTEINGVMVGGEAIVAVTPRFSAEIAAQGSLNAKPSIDGFENPGWYTSKSASVFSYRLKGICMVNSNLGIALGYRAIAPDIKYDNDIVGVELHNSLESVTLGVEARF